MTGAAFALVAVLLLVVLVCVKPLGLYMAAVSRDSCPSGAARGCSPSSIVSIACAPSSLRARWIGASTRSRCSLNGVGSRGAVRAAALQAWLPLNPQHFAAPGAGLGLQHGGELRHQHQLAGVLAAKSTMSYLTQMAGLAVQNFLSAATGIVGGDRIDSRARAPQRRAPSAISGWI